MRLLVLDVDGVLTDGSLQYTGAGEELKAFNSQDGLGVKMLQSSGVEIAIITGRSSRAVALRARELGVERLFQATDDKLHTFSVLLQACNVEASQVACVGDDLPDLPLMTRCGFAATVPEAPEVVRNHAHYVTQRAGGRGAVREVCELLMHAQGTLVRAIQTYLR